MAKEKMRWNPHQKRWQKDYKRRTLYVTPKDLGGTSRQDTVSAANRWFEDAKARIDAEDGITRLRANEGEYRNELDRLGIEAERLEQLKNDPALRPVVEKTLPLWGMKSQAICQELQNKSLSPLEDSMRSPLSLSEKEMKEATDNLMFEKMLENQWQDYLYNRDDESWLRRNNYYHYNELCDLSDEKISEELQCCTASSMRSDLFHESFWEEVDALKESWTHQSNGNHREVFVRTAVDALNYLWICRQVRYELKEINSFAILEKRRRGMIDEYDRGVLSQRLYEERFHVPKERSLAKHIEGFLTHQETRYHSKKIGAGRLGNYLDYMKDYKMWAEQKKTRSVDHAATVGHVNAYHASINERLIQGKISSSHAEKLFIVFKHFMFYLKDERVIDFMPPWLGRHDDKYTFKHQRKEPEILPLDVVRKLIVAASPRVKLFILLGLNCGFGQAEIGRLEKSEYDPVQGTITHKRVKTARCQSVPKVTYRLWDRTKELLDRQIKEQEKCPRHDEHRNLLLLNENGKPLWSERFEGNRYIKSDNIICQFKRFIKKLNKDGIKLPKCQFYMFRRTASTHVFNSEKYSHLDWLFLGHAPKTTAGQHYSVALAGILDQCLAWLEGKIFDEQATSSQQ